MNPAKELAMMLLGICICVCIGIGLGELSDRSRFHETERFLDMQPDQQLKVVDMWKSKTDEEREFIVDFLSELNPRIGQVDKKTTGIFFEPVYFEAKSYYLK